MTYSTPTARQARAILFPMSSEAANNLRQEFFEIADQDAPLSLDNLERFLEVAFSSPLSSALLRGPATVKQLSARSMLSESRVRELLKVYDNVQSDGGRPAKFWLNLDNPEPQAKEQPTEENLAEEQLVEEPQDDSVCPFCDAENSDMTPTGPEGTFLGDSVLLCHKCEKAHNIFSGVEVNLPGSRKSRKSPLNPQYKIDAKVAAVESAGGTLTYDKASRFWALQLPQYKTPVLLTSQEFSLFDHKTIVELH